MKTLLTFMSRLESKIRPIFEWNSFSYLISGNMNRVNLRPVQNFGKLMFIKLSLGNWWGNFVYFKTTINAYYLVIILDFIKKNIVTLLYLSCSATPWNALSSHSHNLPSSSFCLSWISWRDWTWEWKLEGCGCSEQPWAVWGTLPRNQTQWQEKI